MIAADHCRPFGDQENEAGNFFFRRLPPQKKHPVAGAIEFIKGVLEQTPLEPVIFSQQFLEIMMREATKLAIGDGFSEIGIGFGKYTTEKIGRKQQADNGLTSVLGRFVELDHTADDIAEKINRHFGRHDDAAALEFIVPGYFAQLSQLFRRKRATNALMAYSTNFTM